MGGCRSRGKPNKPKLREASIVRSVHLLSRVPVLSAMPNHRLLVKEQAYPIEHRGW